MRSALRLAALCAALTLVSPSVLRAQGSVDGFGAFSLNNVSSFAGSSLPFDFGGRVSVDLAPPVQAVGEVGRLGNILPTVTTTVLGFLPVSVRGSAFYFEGGVRFASPDKAVAPYVEATAGIARLDFGVSGFGAGTDAITRGALNLLDRTDPLAGVGGGVLFRHGPLLLDLGYRYKKIFADDLVGSLLSAGQGLESHQVRVGVGVRF
jgi:opacity protein-like surface antigen